MNNKNFFIDLLGRLISDNPKFFKYIQWVSIAVAAITGLPDFLSMFGINLTGQWLMFENKTIAIAAIVAGIISKLPNNTPKATTQDDTSVGGGTVGTTKP